MSVIERLIELGPHSLQEEARTELARLERIETVVKWVLNDAAYKPPEVVGVVGERWREVLARTLES